MPHHLSGHERRLLRRIDAMGEKESVRIAGVIHDTAVNGPGRRAIVHFQGCNLGCPGCFNTNTHDPNSGRLVTVGALADELVKKNPDGISISGGEPFQQITALKALVTALRRRKIVSILVFTGYTLREIEQRPHGAQALEGIDVVVAGRFDATLSSGGALLGSANQRIHLLTNAHEVDELQVGESKAELHIGKDGTIQVTGFPSPKLRRALRLLKK